MARSHQLSQQQAADRVYGTFQRAGLAACIVLAPVVLFLGFAVDPTGGLGVPENLQGVAASIKAASPLQIQWFLSLNAVTVYFFLASLHRSRTARHAAFTVAGNHWDDLRFSRVASLWGLRGAGGSGLQSRSERVYRGHFPVCPYSGVDFLARGKLGGRTSGRLPPHGHDTAPLAGHPLVGSQPVHRRHSLAGRRLWHSPEYASTHLLCADLHWQYPRRCCDAEGEKRKTSKVEERKEPS